VEFYEDFVDGLPSEWNDVRILFASLKPKPKPAT
jgi:hypothetical protein